MANGFSIERLINCGQYLHFHTHMEIYGVIKGRVAVIISGERGLLTEGQMAIVDKYENHSIETDVESELVVLRVEPNTLRPYSYLYSNRKLPRWLMDVSFNKGLFENIERYSSEAKSIQSELRATGIVCELLADVIEHYGLESVKQTAAHDLGLVVKIVQYIYEHYNEKITLETLSNQFHISPTVLSKKLRKRLGVDLRVFVNDLRVQKVIQILNEPEQENKTLYEIAMSCGFTSMSTFYRCYKRNFSFGTLHDTEEMQQE